MIQHLSIVLPVYNEEETLLLLRQRMNRVLDDLEKSRRLRVEVIFVDDGSKDLTPQILENWAGQDRRLRVLRFSRNFGHQAALTAGLDAARGDAVVFMDSDLQDPPELIPALLDKQAEGHEVVYARRISRAGEGPFKRWTAWAFYRLMKKLVHPDLPADAGDFRLLAGPALEALRGMRESHRFLRGMSAWIGFRQAEVPYQREARAAGETKYPLFKMLQLAWNAAVSFSTLPLKLVTLWGTLVSLFGLGYLGYTVYRHLAYRDTVPGWASLIVILCLIGGSILVSLGVLGSYVGKIFEESKKRPLYIVESSFPRSKEVTGGPDGDRDGERVDVPRCVGVGHEA